MINTQTDTHTKTQATTISKGQNWPQVLYGNNPNIIPCFHWISHCTDKAILRFGSDHCWVKVMDKVKGQGHETYNPSNSCQLYLMLFILASFNNLRVDLEMNGQGQGH